MRELFGDGIAELRTERRANRQAFRSPEHYLDFFGTYFGPLRSAFEQVGPEGAPALEADLRAYLEKIRGDSPALVTRTRVPAGRRGPRLGAARQRRASGGGALGLGGFRPSRTTLRMTPISITPKKMRPETAPPWPSQA